MKAEVKAVSISRKKGIKKENIAEGLLIANHGFKDDAHAGDWHSPFSKALGHISFVAAIVAPLMIGSVFGLTESRVTYFGPVMSIYCLMMAILIGSALCLFYNLVLSKIGNN